MNINFEFYNPANSVKDRIGVSIIDAAEAEFDAAACGLPDAGAILIRPDGFIGFRATPVDDAMVDAIHAHLAIHLIPNVVRS